MIEINKTKLNDIIVTILSGKIPEELREVGERIFNDHSNYHFHMNKVNDLLKEVVDSNLPKIGRELSRINITKEPIIKIFLVVKKNDDKISFFFYGDDLKDFYMHLPRFIDDKTKRIIVPTTGTNNSKWFSYDKRYNKYLRNVSLNLRLLDIYLKNCRIINSYDEKRDGILGLEVKFEIPDFLKDNTFVHDFNELKSTLNPTKISEGRFIFGKNGINNQCIEKMFLIMKNNLPFFYEKLYPKLITDFNLEEFVNSPFFFALSCLNRHCRILIKNEFRIDPDAFIEGISTEVKITDIVIYKYLLYILDPWMNYLPNGLNDDLKKNNKDIFFQFIQRNTKDQIKAEGSCVLSALSRLLFLLSDNHYLSKFNLRIPDFYAYLAKLIYRKSICK